MTSDNISSTVPRRQLGRYLREGREAMGMTLDQAAELMQWGKSTLQRLERGNSDRIRDVDIKELCRIYGFDEDRTTALVGLARQAAVKSWWHEFGDIIPENFSVYMGLEGSARKMTIYESDVVHGLLQTRDYIQVLARAGYPEESEAELEHRVQLKVQRQALVTRKTRPVELTVLLHETVLRRMVGSRKIMAKQLRHLANESTRANVDIRVVPFSAGMPTGDQIGPFTILEFGEDTRGRPVEPTIVYAENYTGDMYSEKDGTIRRYEHAYQILQNCSFDEQRSRDLFRTLAREYDRDR